MKSCNITSVFREHQLKLAFKTLKPGVVLDVGAKNGPYIKFIPHTKYYTLDIDKGRKPDFCTDIHKTNLPANKFDTVILTEVLEHLADPEKAVYEIYRILKPGGVCIASTPAFYHFHPDPKDFYRYTVDSLNYLFNQFKKVVVRPHGNRIHLIWQIIIDTFPTMSFFTSFVYKYQRPDEAYPLGFVVIAQK